MADVKLDHVTSPEGDNYYDITFTDGNFTLTRGLVTSFLMSIFCEQRDDSIEVPQNRGGWAGNELQPIVGFQQGSLIWTLYQSMADEDAATKAQQFIENGLQWLIDDLIAKDVQVEVSVVANNKLQAKIVVIQNDDTEFVNFYDLWLNTVNQN